MSRFFAPITVEELKKKIQDNFGSAVDAGRWNPRTMIDKLGKDVKVSFDLENFSDGEFGPKILLGYRTLRNGMTYLGMCAGGDWQSPVFYICYFDGKKLRGYVPTDGNPWNTSTNQAYGDDDEADLKNAKKRWPEQFQEDEEFDAHSLDFDIVLIEKDIMNRILPVGEKGKPKEKAKPKVKPKPNAKEKSLQERITSLVFYGTGDEAYELFDQACSFCYRLWGLGSEDWAMIVCGWAEEMAWASAEDEFASANDTARGQWG